MKIITSISRMREWVAAQRAARRTVGFVPTMGALHEGHLVLVRAAVAECGAAAASIFVNPAQFGPGEDFDRYPRQLDADARLLEEAGCGALFAAERDEIYPAGFETWVAAERLPNHLCGLSRPGHFRGVTTAVAKLFNIVTPDRAYFGWKDAQQAIIIARMVRDLNFNIEVRILPTVRDRDGLALSSRNRYLSEEERERALVIPRVIARAKAYFEAGQRDGTALLNDLRAMLERTGGLEVDYLSLVSVDDLQETDQVVPGTMLALAVRVGRTRLIDNCRFAEDSAC